MKPSLDLALYGKAQLEGKEVGGLETVEEQLGVFEHFSTREQVEFLRTILREMQKPGKGPVEQLIQLYLAGDLDALSREVNRQMTKDETLLKKINRVMFTERDQRMADPNRGETESVPGGKGLLRSGRQPTWPGRTVYEPGCPRKGFS